MTAPEAAPYTPAAPEAVHSAVHSGRDRRRGSACAAWLFAPCAYAEQRRAAPSEGRTRRPREAAWSPWLAHTGRGQGCGVGAGGALVINGAGRAAVRRGLHGAPPPEGGEREGYVTPCGMIQTSGSDDRPQARTGSLKRAAGSCVAGLVSQHCVYELVRDSGPSLRGLMLASPPKSIRFFSAHAT
jgi:hypothetical protein